MVRIILGVHCVLRGPWTGPDGMEPCQEYPSAVVLLLAHGPQFGRGCLIKGRFADMRVGDAVGPEKEMCAVFLHCDRFAVGDHVDGLTD